MLKGKCSRTTWASAAAVVAVAVFFAGGPGAAGAPAQEPAPQARFEATVELVQLQVAVTDEQGRFIPGLDAGDFALRVNGRRRSVASVYTVDLNSGGGAATISDTTAPAAAWRQFLLFFDLSFNSPRGILRAREAAEQFLIERVRPGDLVAVATFSYLDGLRLLTPFTPDRAQVLYAIGTLGLKDANKIVDPAGFVFEEVFDQLASSLDVPGGSAAGVAGFLEDLAEEQLRAVVLEGARVDQQRYNDHVFGFAAQLRGLGELLQAVRGRKHVVFFSEGFAGELIAGRSVDDLARDAQRANERGEYWTVDADRFGRSDMRNRLDDAVAALQSADALVHVFDTSGLTASDERGANVDRRGQGQDTLFYLASGTDGTVNWNTNDIAGALASLEAATRSFYVLSYTPQRDDGLVVEVEVSVNRPDAVVSAPSRFGSAQRWEDLNALQRQVQLAEYISKDIDEQPIPFDMQVIPFVGRRGVARLAVLVELPWEVIEGLVNERNDGRASLEIFGYALGQSGRMIDFFSRKMEFDISMLRSRRSGLGRGLRYYDLLWAGAGEHQVRCIVREGGLGQISSRTLNLEVPEFREQELLVSGPVFIAMTDPGVTVRGFDPDSPPERRADGPIAYPFALQRQQLMPQVWPELGPGSRFQVFLVAYNLAIDASEGKPKAGVEMILVDEEGQPSRLEGISLIAQEFDAESDSLTMVLEAGIPAGVRSGTGSIWLRVVDDLAGKRVERKLPFLLSDSAGG